MSEEHPAPPGAQREKIFNLPGVVAAVIWSLAAIQLAMSVLPSAFVAEAYSNLSFIPARISFILAPDAFMRAFAETFQRDGVERSDIAAVFNANGEPWWTLFTYALLHGGWTHLAVNCVTLAAFGAPLARRFGPGRFLSFFAVTAIAGALAHLAVHPFDLAPVVGASAAISGTMAASARFAFTPGVRLGGAGEASPEQDDGAQGLSSLLSNRRALAFLAMWFGVNLLFGLVPQAAGASEQIAWEAHVGGFAAGLLLFGLFDRRRVRGVA
ncbi:MAG: rhomboid family intramembrane serine protease [Methylocystaceae bacterium]|nr:MAG: rhomboid family intramembrane serine protease [Methylocystaceae bacterium]